MTLPWAHSHHKWAWITKGLAPIKHGYSLWRSQTPCSVKLHKSRGNVALYLVWTQSYKIHKHQGYFGGFYCWEGFPMCWKEISSHWSHFVFTKLAFCCLQPWKLNFRCWPETLYEHQAQKGNNHLGFQIFLQFTLQRKREKNYLYTGNYSYKSQSKQEKC